MLEGLAPAAAEPAVLSKGTIAEKGLTAGRGRTEGGDGRVDPMLQTRPAVEINPLGRGDPQSSLAGPIATADVPRPVVTDAMPRVEGAINASEGATSEEADITTQLTTSTSAQPSTDARRSGSGWPEALDGPVDFSGARKGRQRSDDPFQDIAPDQLNWPQGQARGLGRAAERGPSFAAHLPAPLPHGLGHQLADAVARFPGRPVEVTLSPEELGRVRMTLTTVDGGLTLTLVADRPETLDLMRRHIGQLAQDFRDMGFQNLSFSFAQGQDPRRAPERSLLVAEDDAALAAAPQEIPRPKPMKPLPHIPAEGLDIRI